MVHYYLDGEDFAADPLTDEEMEDAIQAFEDDYFDEDDYDGQPDEYTEWQDFMGGDDWDHGQYDEF